MNPQESWVKNLIHKIQVANPTAVITDCLSCRLQFEQMLSFPVYHPLEILASAYEAALKPAL